MDFCQFPQCRATAYQGIYCQYHSRLIRLRQLCYNCRQPTQSPKHSLCHKCYQQHLYQFGLCRQYPCQETAVVTGGLCSKHLQILREKDDV